MKTVHRTPAWLARPLQQTPDTDPRCLDCEHYHVTWDRSAPHGCSAFGFKTSRRPSRVVRETSGSCCELYLVKSREG